MNNHERDIEWGRLIHEESTRVLLELPLPQRNPDSAWQFLTNYLDFYQALPMTSKSTPVAHVVIDPATFVI